MPDLVFTLELAQSVNFISETLTPLGFSPGVTNPIVFIMPGIPPVGSGEEWQYNDGTTIIFNDDAPVEV